jgi:hypothetical protein
MLRRLVVIGVIAVGGVLPFAVSAHGSSRADALCFGSAATISGSGTFDGTEGDDVLVGSDGNDSIHGKGGNDKICGGGGDDKLGGGPGNDQLDGGAGNDDLDGGPGTDTLLGGEGDDHIDCGGDNDVADGGPGTNTAATSGFEACETVTNANPTETAPNPNPVAATLNVGQARPHPKGTRGASGRFSATVTSTGVGATVVWRLTFSRLTGPAVAAHIHLGKPGTVGAVLASLCSPCSSGAQGTLQVDGQPARKALLSGEAYVDVHTAKNPRGEIRGQIRRP